MNRSIDHTEGSSTESIAPGKNIAKGNYILEVKNADGSISIKNNLRF